MADKFSDRCLRIISFFFLLLLLSELYRLKDKAGTSGKGESPGTSRQHTAGCRPPPASPHGRTPISALPADEATPPARSPNRKSLSPFPEAGSARRSPPAPLRSPPGPAPRPAAGRARGRCQGSAPRPARPRPPHSLLRRAARPQVSREKRTEGWGELRSGRGWRLFLATAGERRGPAPQLRPLGLGAAVGRGLGAAGCCGCSARVAALRLGASGGALRGPGEAAFCQTKGAERVPQIKAALGSSG